MLSGASSQNKFSYHALSLQTRERGIVSNESDGYEAMRLGDQEFIFVSAMRRTHNPSNVGKFFSEYGLKFHISLPEDDPTQFSHAWSVVFDVLAKHDIAGFKVIADYKKMSDIEGQEGKDVTIYADHNPEKTLEQWQELLQELTMALTKANIKPGYRPSGTVEKPEKPVSGSNYITYRYENEYYEKVAAWPKRDPIVSKTEYGKRIKVKVKGQPPIAILSANKITRRKENQPIITNTKRG